MLMISIIVSVIVAVVFLVAIISVWFIHPGSKLWNLQCNGYDKKDPPTKKEWRSSQWKYSALLLFLGILSTFVIWMVTR